MKKFLTIFLVIGLFISSSLSTFAATIQDDYLIINKNSKHLGSRLHKEYDGHIYSIQNKTNYSINIDSITFQDDVSSTVAYSTIKRSSLKKGLETIGTGLIFALPTLSISLIGAVVISPFVMISNTIGNIGAKQDSNRFDKRNYSNILQPNAEIKLKVLGVKHHTPKIIIIYHTNENDNIGKIEL